MAQSTNSTPAENLPDSSTSEPLEAIPSPDGPANPGSLEDETVSHTFTNDEPETRSYQDNLDTGNEMTDPFADENTDEPSNELQIPRSEFKNELDGLVLDDSEASNDDIRETLEDRDEDSQPSPQK